MHDDTLTLAPEITLQSVMAQGEFEFFSIHENGIAFREECPEEEWLALTKHALTGLEASGVTHCRMMAKVADCINFGETKFGSRHSQALDATRGYLKYNEKTVANACWVFSKIEEERRRVDTLTLSHHEAVAKLDPEEQDEFLAKAENEALSVSALKDEIKERHPSKPKKLAKTTPAKKDGAPKITEDEAIKAAETLANYFDQAEEADGPLSKWDAKRIERLNKVMHQLEMCAKRLRNAAKKNKAAK